MPGHMDKGTKNYRNMMKNMEKMGMKGSISDNERDMLSQMSETFSPEMRPKGSGVTSDAELKAIKDALGGSVMTGMTQSDMLDTEKEAMMKMQRTGALSDAEMRMLEDTFGANLTDELRNAFAGLRNMGISVDEALEALNMSLPDNMTRQRMTEGALGSLPERPVMPTMRPQMPERLDADRTQSMDMQKTGMGT